MSNGLDIQFIRESYQKMTDNELIRIATKESSGLTQEAQQVLDQEIDRRNIDLTSINNLGNELNKKHVVIKDKRSLEFALLFTFLFGPFGLLYVSVTYGIILIVLGIIGFETLGYIGLILVWS